MDKIILTTQDIEWLLRWRDEHPSRVRELPATLKAIKIECKDSGWIIKGFRDGNRITLQLGRDGKSFGSKKFEILEGGFLSSPPEKDKMQVSDEDKQSVLTVYCSLMALMTFGNIDADFPEATSRAQKAPHKPHHSSNKKRKKIGTTYILRNTPSGLRAVSLGSHASPGYAFSVRGHYRHYKSGKVVWISEFTKGTGKRKDRTYKIGGRV